MECGGEHRDVSAEVFVFPVFVSGILRIKRAKKRGIGDVRPMHFLWGSQKLRTGPWSCAVEGAEDLEKGDHSASDSFD